MPTTLVTGAAGFIGFHLAERLLRDGHQVIGLDAFTPYYDVRLKHARWAKLRSYTNFIKAELDLEALEPLRELVTLYKPEIVLHMAAQAGVRHSLMDPASYIGPNIQGTFHLLEALREVPPKHLLMASTSSVYGGNKPPFKETDATDYPVSFYAATKKAGEAMVHSYAHLWQIPTTMLRFFTVYGPWGRPDMALFKFIEAILAGEPLSLYNKGQMSRDFTYIDDVVESVVRLMPLAPTQGPDTSPVAPYRVVNIASGRPVALNTYIEALEKATGLLAQRHYDEMQKGDVKETLGDITRLTKLTGFKPSTPVEAGVQAFVDWYRSHGG